MDVRFPAAFTYRFDRQLLTSNSLWGLVLDCLKLPVTEPLHRHSACQRIELGDVVAEISQLPPSLGEVGCLYGPLNLLAPDFEDGVVLSARQVAV